MTSEKGTASRRAETAAPTRNFGISVEERVRAIAGGPPAYIRRRRAIEDLEQTIVRTLVERCAEAEERGLDARAHAGANAPARALERLADLVERHNRWYPIEANLPMHPRTGELLDRTGEPWRPMAAPKLESFIVRAVRLFEESRPSRTG